ncbi:MAG: sodium-independent anion transporter [Clostridia bacterium]|nr:sodium-independent anion transporter [Clostridia bacterium]
MKEFYLKPKFFETVKGYKKEQLIKDVVAGIIVAIIALPLSIALAMASGAEPQQGIYTAIFAGFIVALFGGSNVQITGPTAAFATVVAGIINNNGQSGLIIATLMAGIILVVMGVLKLGALIKYVPKTITVGFTAGIAVTIAVGQIKDFLGITYQTSEPIIETFDKIKENIHNISSFNWQSLVIGAICLAILIIYPKFEKRVPPSLIAVIVGALLVKFVPFFSGNVDTIGSLYEIESGFPQFKLGTADFNFDTIISLIPSAFAIAFLAGVESLLSCVVADSMTNTKHNPNSELVAQGLGNMASVAFGGIPATGAIARTAANIKNGGKTPVSGMVHAVVLLLVVLLLMPLAKLIPMPTIAAILFIVAYNMSEWRSFIKIIKQKNITDIFIMVLTFVLTVAKDLVVAIIVALVLHFAILLIKKLFKKA